MNQELHDKFQLFISTGEADPEFLLELQHNDELQVVIDETFDKQMNALGQMNLILRTQDETR